jgi:hypothetical protein
VTPTLSVAVNEEIGTVRDVEVDGMVKAVMDGLVVSTVGITTQVLLLALYPELHEDKVQVPYVDQIPELQVRD